MKITVFYSSIHKAQGNTYVIVEEFVKGAIEAGAQAEVIFLAERDIHECMACTKCWTKTPGKCVLKDDMAGLLDLFMQSDLAVMATPVYVHNVNGVMKTFLDRIIPVIDPHLVKMENGVTGHVKNHEKFPRFGVIATGGFPEQACCAFVSQYFRRIVQDLYSDVAFEIYKSQAVLLKLADKVGLGSLLDDYKQQVRQAAREVVENGKVSEALAKKLDQPFLPGDLYLEQANKYWDSRIAHYRQKKG
ncbi:MAG: flavodoxin family protein [Thermodesulfobacteriota bacterium]